MCYRHLRASIAFVFAIIGVNKVWAQSFALKLPNGATQVLRAAASPEPTAAASSRFGNRYYYLAHFSQPISKVSGAAGIQLLAPLTTLDGYISTGAPLTPAQAKAAGISHFAVAAPDAKLSTELLQRRLPQHALLPSGQYQILMGVHADADMVQVKAWLTQMGYSHQPLAINARVIRLSIDVAAVNTVALQPFVAFMQAANGADRVLNQNVRSASRAFSLNAPLVNGGRNLNGAGIVAGIGDDSDPSLHPDLTDRVIDRSFGITNDHGTHVAGTVAGGGVLVDANRGFAALATLVTQFFSGMWEYAAQYVQDFDMVVANHSYANTAGECYYNGVYDLYSNLLDEQAQTLPFLQHVFAAGNSGDDVCSPYPANYGTVLGSYQSAKNTLCVGRADLVQVASQGSSVGPVKDGRIKPDISVLGELTSTSGPDDYSTLVGTSMSAPSATGGLVLLNERYRQLHGTKPRADLMKNLLMNGARDIGNPGPDYKAGFGLMHLENSLRILEQNRYFSGSLAPSATNDYTITVPSGAAALKVMLYWNDAPANPLATQTLVNDLDLTVIDPSSTTIYPKVLSTTPANVANAATEGIDRINNVEQVVILNPTPGTYTIRASAFLVAVNPTQAYTITYDFLPTTMAISVPFAGDSWPAGQPIPIGWDDEGTAPGTYTLDYSVDNGATWVLAETGIPATQRFRNLTFPTATATNQARVRLSKAGAPSAVSGMFTVIGTPINSLAAIAQQCRGYTRLNWTAVAGADDYELVMKKGPLMVGHAIVSSATLSYNFSGLNPDSNYYVSVRARKGGVAGRYSYAPLRRPNTGGCGSGISDGDLRLDSIVSPLSGRLFTASALSATQDLVVRIRNLDDVAINSFDLQYRVNGSPITTISIAIPIAAGGTYTHTIPGLNLSSVGAYNIEAIVKNTATADAVASNDTFRTTVLQLPNAPLTLTTTPLVENFDASAVTTLSRNTIGIDNLTAWDYFNFDRFGRARTFVNTGVALSGNRAITLDVSKAPPNLTTPGNLLVGTFNLSPHTVANDVRFDFSFVRHGSLQGVHALNKVWVRGTDANPWIEVYDLGVNHGVPGQWKASPSLEVSDALQAAGQNFSTSTQLRFGQRAQYSMADMEHLAGYSFDDVRLYLASNDAQLLAIDTPGIYSCGLNATVPIRITVRNSMNTAITNVPVSYTINGGPPVNEVISNIAANTSVVYQFAATANLLAVGEYAISASVSMPGDNVTNNNTQLAHVRHQAVVSSYPYLENFETGNGGFFVSGQNASWQYGTPASLLINSAASGTKAWKTTLVGTYKAMENSYLNSPCFSTVGLTNPTLSFSMAYDIEDCSPFGVVCDAAWIEYSTNGTTWTKLGAFGQGTNWYDNSANNIWLKRKQTHWHVATIPLPTNASNLRLRFAMRADEFTNYEGVAIDDIHIYDKAFPIYTSVSNSNAVVQSLSGSLPISIADASNLLVQVNPNGIALGNTEAKAWMDAGPIRVFNNQYYGSRTLTVKPTTDGVGPKTVRYFFTDQEANALRNATGCVTCTPPKDFSEMAITQYTNTNKALEDGDFGNNVGGVYTYHDDLNVVFVPYDNGYYAEIEVDSFSEFWLNEGNVTVILPIDFAYFKAVKLNENTARLEWQSKNNAEQHLYNIEVAYGDAAAANGDFEKIGTVMAASSSNGVFQFLHPTAGASGTLYYRIAQVSKNGSLYYSALRPLQFGAPQFSVKLYPQPASDRLTLLLAGTQAAPTQVVMYSLQGQVLLSQTLGVASGNGTQAAQLSLRGVAAGVYLLKITNGTNTHQAKVVVQ
ncbi:MAG: T9SS C-terminal target domain-containing protein [Bacteroidetes bacterium]|nr:MAG: T9SS C-terminal target domain-containing protein [Bacteroidota bacterium]